MMGLAAERAAQLVWLSSNDFSVKCDVNSSAVCCMMQVNLSPIRWLDAMIHSHIMKFNHVPHFHRDSRYRCRCCMQRRIWHVSLLVGWQVLCESGGFSIRRMSVCRCERYIHFTIGRLQQIALNNIFPLSNSRRFAAVYWLFIFPIRTWCKSTCIFLHPLAMQTRQKSFFALLWNLILFDWNLKLEAHRRLIEIEGESSGVIATHNTKQVELSGAHSWASKKRQKKGFFSKSLIWSDWVWEGNLIYSEFEMLGFLVLQSFRYFTNFQSSSFRSLLRSPFSFYFLLHYVKMSRDSFPSSRAQLFSISCMTVGW